MLYSQYDHLAPWNHLIIGDPGTAWRSNSKLLAPWAWDFYVLRTDGYGRYRTDAEVKKLTAILASQLTTQKRKKKVFGQTTEHLEVTLALLESHFDPIDKLCIIGMLCYAVNLTSDVYYIRSLGIDIDNHDSPVPLLENHRFAIAIYKRLRKLGYHPLLTDSNGASGFHIEVSFDGLVECWKAQAIGNFVTSDYAQFNQKTAPEVYPRSIGETPKSTGNWLRMPGKHHSRDHWSGVWNGGTLWLTSLDAVNYLLNDTMQSTYNDDPRVEAYWKMSHQSHHSSPKHQSTTSPGGVAISKYLTPALYSELKRARSALMVYTAEDADNNSILRVASALKPYGAPGRELFLSWLNATGPNAHWRCSTTRVYDMDYFEDLFERASLGACTYKTILKHAKELGWVPPEYRS